MSAVAVVIAHNGRGVPVKPVESGAPVMTVAENGLGAPIVLSERGAPFVVEGLAPVTLFYVDPAGSDSNDGRSPGSAWQTLAKVNAETIPAGAQVLFKGGETFLGSLVLREGQHYGLPGAPVTYGSYGLGRATIQTADNTHSGIDALNPHDVTIRDLIVIGTGKTISSAVGVKCINDLLGDSKLPGLQLLDLEVSQFGDDGIALKTSDAAEAALSASGWAGAIIDGCVAHDCTGNTTVSGASGITVRGLWGLRKYPVTHTDLIIRNCVAYNNSGTSGVTPHSGNGIFIGECDGALIEHCLAYNNGGVGRGLVGIWMHDSLNSVIQFCVSRDNKTQHGTSDGGGFDIDGGCQNCIIQYCYSANNHGAGYLLYQYGGYAADLLVMSGNVFRYNISQNDASQDSLGKGSIMIGCGDFRNQPNNLVYGNTVFSHIADGACVHFPTEGANDWIVGGGFFNNILVAAGTNTKLINTGGGITPWTTFLWEGNLYRAPNGVSIKWGWTTYFSIAAWRGATGRETFGGEDTSVYGDPMFAGALPIPSVDDVTDPSIAAYQTIVGSPARGNGQDLIARFGIDPPRDFFGNVVPQNQFDMGTFESDTITALPLELNGTPVTSAVAGQPYTGFTVTAQRGTPPYVYSLVGTWPAGITIDSNTGAVSGTPTEGGSFVDLSVQVTDGNSDTAQLPAFALTVVASTGEYTFAASGGIPIGWSTAGWSDTEVTWSQDAGVLRGVNTNHTPRKALGWTELGSQNDVEVLTKTRALNILAGQASANAALLLRGSGNGNFPYGYRLSLFNDASDVKSVHLAKYVNNAQTNLLNVPYAWVVGAWYWMRFRAEGTQLSFKVWADGEPEPGDWTGTFVDSSLASGWLGVHAPSPATHEWDEFTYGLNGASAPTPPLTEPVVAP